MAHSCSVASNTAACQHKTQPDLHQRTGPNSETSSALAEWSKALDLNSNSIHPYFYGYLQMCTIIGNYRLWLKSDLAWFRRVRLATPGLYGIAVLFHR
ncbi:hypothetical protein KCV07_g13, partial [Aureobasidium melanogenum]